MSNKQLTATVKLNSSQAEQKLKNIAKAIDNINRAVGKNSNVFNKVNTALAKTDNQIKKVANATTRLGAMMEKIRSLSARVRTKVSEWATQQRKVNSAASSTNSIFGSIWSRLKGIAATYLGIMGMRAVAQTTDTITSAENKFNYLNGGDINATKETMDKMYNSAQKVRMGYSDMMANVSKSMTLAGDAFQGNVDNAIRFQEIMAEAYAVGGASAAEMSSSMYQMIQALGAGVLQGDELRSVREGAPLAYKAIEEFAQGVYRTEESLKDLASQGKITADMVVAAVTTAGNEMDAAFAQTKQTFAQTWTQIKNAATQAFRPVGNMLRDELNKAIDNGLLGKIESAFTTVSKVLQIMSKVIINTINWIADNWDWVKNAIIAGLIMIGAHAIITAVQWLKLNWQMLLTVGAIFAIIYAVILFKQGMIDACTTAGIALLGVAAIAFLVFGWQVALIIALVALVIMFFDKVCGVGWMILTFIGNLCQTIGNIIAVMLTILLFLVIGTIYTAIAFIINLISGLLNVIGGACNWIGDKWSNLCANMEYQFWNAIANMVEDCEWLINALNKVAEFFGKETISVEGLRGKADAAKSKIKDVGSFTEAVGSAWNKGWNTVDWFDWNNFDSVTKDATTAFGTGLSDWNWKESYSDGSNFGSSVQGAINNWASKFQNNVSEKGSLLDNIGNKLGLNFNEVFPGNVGLNTTSGGFDPSQVLGNIDDNTGKMADSMDLTNEDLEYLRRIADMEWKKEYTTAEIKVEMTNNNQINGDGDLDGIVTKLSDKLYEELNVVANGVYAY